MIKFANNDRSRLGCASFDGTLSVCNVTSIPPVVECIFRGHSNSVTGKYVKIFLIFSNIQSTPD